jgi:antitoxin ParD1/3/4
MPTRNVSLTREQDAFIAKVVEAGEYQNASEAVRDALRALQQRRREDALRLATLRARVETGIRDLEEGDSSSSKAVSSSRSPGSASRATRGCQHEDGQRRVLDAAVASAPCGRQRRQ